MNLSGGPPSAPAACPVCRSESTREHAVACDRLFRLVPGRFRLRRCDSCRCLFQDPMPDAAAVDGYYPRTYWWTVEAPGRKADAGIQRRLQERYRELVVRDHVRFLKRCAAARGLARASVLDLGCGSGTFLASARRAGFEVAGMEVSAAAARAAHSSYGLDVREGSIGSPIWGERRFDFVTLFHVVEHLPEPARALEFARGLLAPGGSAIVQVPNVESIQARVFGKRWYGLDVPRHLVNFTPRGLEVLIRRAGLRVARRASFSWRDNPASIASSLAPGLDPIGRRGRGEPAGVSGLLRDLVYLGLVVLSLPPALAESAAGRGGTIWIEAVPQESEAR